MIATNETQKPAVWCPGLTPNLDITRGLRRYWPMWEGKGLNAYSIADSSAALRNDSSAGGSEGLPQWVPGRLGHSLLFSGARQFILYPSFNVTGAKGNSWSVWFSSVAPVGAAMTLIADNTLSFGVSLDNQSGQSRLRYRNLANENLTFFADKGLFDGGWYLVSFTQDEQATRIFVNGIEAQTSPLATFAGSANRWQLTGWGGTGSTIADLAIWDRTLSPGEVKWLYRNPFGMCRMPDPTYAPLLISNTPTAIGIHIVRVNFVDVNSFGQFIDKNADTDNPATIGNMLDTRSEHRIIPDASISNSAGYPTVLNYVEAEAASDYVVHYMDQNMIITHKHGSGPLP